MTKKIQVVVYCPPEGVAAVYLERFDGKRIERGGQGLFETCIARLVARIDHRFMRVIDKNVAADTAAGRTAFDERQPLTHTDVRIASGCEDFRDATARGNARVAFAV